MKEYMKDSLNPRPVKKAITNLEKVYIYYAYRDPGHGGSRVAQPLVAWRLEWNQRFKQGQDGFRKAFSGFRFLLRVNFHRLGVHK